MFVAEKNEFAKWLDGKFVAWMLELGESKDQKDFARWLGITPVTLNRHLTGARVPKQDDPIIDTYAEKLGPQVYDVLGYKRPDPLLDQLIAALDTTPEDQKQDLVRRILDLISEVEE